MFVRSVGDEARPDTEVVHELACLECGAQSEGSARGWQAHLHEGELLVYCDTCGGREFGADADD